MLREISKLLRFLSIFLQSGQPLNCVLKNFAAETDSAYFALHHLKAMYNAESDKANKKFVSCYILLGALGLKHHTAASL